uniref:Mp1-like effector n=1 Tax=Rhopalosiphum padi TaxID=40932 RepID=A0A1S6EKM4_RHOPD|nr:Mp1-like effector [Rhopalosiphum padi]
MTVKISVFVVVLIVAYACAEVYQPSTLSMSMPYMPYYPMDVPAYNDYKKSIYTLNQALANICFNAQGAYDYYSLYKDQPGLNLELKENKVRFEKALKHFDDKMNEYRQALLNYKMLLGYKNQMPVSLDDNIPIDPDLLM